MPGEVRLELGGVRYGGWTAVSITRGIEQIAGTFDLQVTERWPDQQTARAIRPGESCRLAIDGEVVITGYVDEVAPSYAAEEHIVGVRGRDVTGDLVDCSAVRGGGQFTGLTLTGVAQSVCAPFGIAVSATADVGAPFRTLAIQEGESVFELLERAARMRGLLLVSDGRGSLVLCRAGGTLSGGRLVAGENILAASGQFSLLDRFSRYAVKGQSQGWDTGDDGVAAGPSAVAEDTAVTRYRPLILVAEDQADIAACRTRALWERNVRAGRGTRASVTVQGWRDSAGALWHPNRLVRIDDDWLGLHTELLITSCTFSLDEQGTRTELGLARREAYEVAALPEPDPEAVWSA